MVRHCEKIIERTVWRPLPRDYELAHVESIDGKVHQSVLFCVIATEPLQVDDQDGRDVVDLDFFDGLLMVEAAIAVPGIRLGEFLWPVELPEAVVDADSF